MAEYSREQRNQLSRAIVNSEAGSKQLKRFDDNRESKVTQMMTHIEYAAKRPFGMGNNIWGAPNAPILVGCSVRARLDRQDPVQGSGTTHGGALQPIINHLGGGWVQGHLLNSKTGGVATDSNLVPITAQANHFHETLVESGVKTRLHNAPLRPPLSPIDYDVEYYVEAKPVAPAAYGIANPDVNLKTHWKYLRPNGTWSAWRVDEILSRNAGAVYANDPNWNPAGTGLGVRTVVRPNAGNLVNVIGGGFVRPMPANWPAGMLFAIVHGGQITSYHVDQPRR